MKYIVILLVILHGLIHLMGFAKAFKMAELSQLKKPISKPTGLIWLLATLLIVFGGVAYALDYEFAWALVGLGILLSQVLIFLSWQDAKIGTIANIILLPIILTQYGAWSAERKFETEVAKLISPLQQEKILNEASMQSLPSILQLWLFSSGALNKPVTQHATIYQLGEMKTSPESDWSSFQAQHIASFSNPGFVWNAKIKAGPGVHVAVLDKFIEGKGSMNVSFQSLINVEEVKGEEIDEGAMQRYLAEMVWTPSFVLSPYVKWEQLDNVRALARMNYRGIEAEVIFTFNARGMVRQVEAQRYFYDQENTRKETWVVNMDESSYQAFQGITMPTKSDITWKLKEGDYTWFRMQVSEVYFNQP